MTRLFKLLSLSVIAWLAVFQASALAATDPRPTYTWQKPADHITFNSITDNPLVGDERQFLWTRGVNDSNFSFPLNVTDNEEVVLQVYYHNNAASNLNLKAKNTRVQIVMPTKTDSTQVVDSFVSADNANPGTVNAVVSLKGSQPFNLVYETGSAKMWNNSVKGASVSDEVVTKQGALIGYEKTDGVVQGGSQYSGFITIKARVHYAKTSASTGTTGVVNTGPGQTAALFVFTALGAAVLHRIYWSRKAA
jgi:hypothetical protein